MSQYAVSGDSQYVRIAILGSGFAGLCMAIKLKQAGLTDFLILERADAVGGTWRDNTYPGCECDVPSHLYSYSFEPEPSWPRPFAAQRDIRAYIDRVADKYDLLPYVRFGHNVEECVYDEDQCRWHVRTNAGAITADVVVAGFGGLSNPLIPDFPGLDRFQGARFHSAQWDHNHDFSGERVAVIGSGASTIQFLPHIAPSSHHLTLFQRTPSWVMPKRNKPFTRLQRWLFRFMPFLRQFYRGQIFLGLEAAGMAFRRPGWMNMARRAGIRHIKQHIRDPEVQKLMTPHYTPGCKRILLSNDFYPAIARENVSVTSSAIEEIREHSIVTADGCEHAVDTIVFGTGFDVANMGSRQRIVGRDGVVLGDLWEQGAEAYLGTMVAGFPNFFLLGGPNSGLGHNSIIFMLEGAVRQTMMALEHMEKSGADSLEVKPEAQRRYNEEVQAKLATTVWATGCESYYKHPTGKIIAIWPGSAASYRRATAKLRTGDLVLGERKAHGGRALPADTTTESSTLAARVQESVGA